LRRRGDWIRTSDLLNPIQEQTQPNPLPDKPDASGGPSGCTSGCTSEGKPEQADPLATLAAALLGLSPADRARLAATLLGQQSPTTENGPKG
jgi:hypothetical protein